MRCACVFIGLGVLLIFSEIVFAGESSSPKQLDVGGNADDTDDYYDDDYDDDALQDKKGGHKHKHKFQKLFLFAGGLKSLAAFIAIKIKIVLVVVAVIGIVAFALKVFGALKYAGYIGGAECPVVHEPAYGLGYSATPPSDHGTEYGAYGDHNDWSSTGSWARSLVENYTNTDFVSHALKNMDMAEMIFATLEMEDEKCRKRLVCELDAKTRQLPLLDYVMTFFSRGFEKYRTPGEKKFKECAKLYPECNDEEESRRQRRRRRSMKKYKNRNHTPA